MVGEKGDGVVGFVEDRHAVFVLGHRGAFDVDAALAAKRENDEGSRNAGHVKLLLGFVGRWMWSVLLFLCIAGLKSPQTVRSRPVKVHWNYFAASFRLCTSAGNFAFHWTALAALPWFGKAFSQAV